MAKKDNLLVGSRVLIDWPMRWRGADAKWVESLKVDARKEAHFGEKATIVAYRPNSPEGRDLTIRLDSTGAIVSLHTGAVTVESLPNDDEVVDLLRQILAALTH